MTSRWTRIGIFLQVGLTLVLAALVAGLVTWLTERPGLHKRVDLTAAKSNTLDPILADLVDSLPEPVKVQLFFQPAPKPFNAVSAEAQQRMLNLLVVAENHNPQNVEVIAHDLGDISTAGAAMDELGIHEVNVAVIHTQDRRAVLRLFKDIARLDPGNPNPNAYRPPSLTSFRGEEAFAKALKAVSTGAAPKILFSTGHGERSLFGTDPRDYGKLDTALQGDGFEVGEWDWREAAELPEDCDVLVIADMKQPMTATEMAAVESFLARGGRLLATPGGVFFNQPGGVNELIGKFGIEAMDGLVASPVPDPRGGWVQGLESCGDLFISAAGLDVQHPITEALYRHGSSTVRFPLARAIRRLNLPQGATWAELARVSELSWIDEPGPSGRVDWTFDENREYQANFPVAVALAFPAPEAPLPIPGEAPRDARIVVLGGADAMSNAILANNLDFLLNTFNWLAAREFRLTIAPRPDDRRILDVRTTTAMASITRVSMLALPLAALVSALVAWWRRRR